ncbi:helix-turn-helix transcriptional regulator [Sphingobacterium faecale]|uniref:Helix-turn-helix transcriptional regulator n=1 Tax=Sphingobacterium faecale TaxID=2803775 RepID=A0ABS1R5Y9_9SPHI|nr:AraC family transcriptional regulator [Sphingobacterium faecale]MBL1409286.1 helix-turn-helix transcriptional regulator [Sphingobacterium faecale]
MGLNLYATDIPELSFSREHPQDQLDASEEYREHKIVLDNPMASGFYHEIHTKDLRISYGDVALAKHTHLHFDSDYESVEMHFALDGNTFASSQNFEKQINFVANQHNIIYANSFRGKMEWREKQLRIFEVNMAPSFFERFLPNDGCDLFDQFRKQMQLGSSTLIADQHQSISIAMFEVIKEIIQCKRKGLFKRIFLETKVVELLLLQLEQLYNQQHMGQLIKRGDIEKMYAVRDFMQTNLSVTCTLTELAHQVGTNEFTLKKNFKELFGTTVFGYWNNVRMDEARRMLQQNEMTIAEVSNAVGYKNPQHFTSAFKRKYNTLPSQVKSC